MNLLRFDKSYSIDFGIMIENTATHFFGFMQQKYDIAATQQSFDASFCSIFALKCDLDHVQGNLLSILGIPDAFPACFGLAFLTIHAPNKIGN